MLKQIIEKPIIFANQKGEELWGVFSLPKIGKNFPAFIMCHGFTKTKSERKFVETARTLAQNQIAVLRFDFSGHGDSEGKLENLSIKKQVKDLKTAQNWLSQQQEIDEEKIAVLGHSLGALTTAVFQAEENSAMALILLSPALHQKELIKQWYTPEQIKLWQKQGYLDTSKGRIGVEYLKDVVSKNWQETACAIKIPTLIIHGSEDDDIPIKYSQEILNKLAGIKKLEQTQKADHHFESCQAKEKLAEICLEWLKKYL